MAIPALLERSVVEAVVAQHVEEAAHLRDVRSILVRAPHVELFRLARTDELLAAHLDGIWVAGEKGAAMCLGALERPGAGTAFALAVQLVRAGRTDALDRLIMLGAAVPSVRRGVLSALGWSSRALAEPSIRHLCGSTQTGAREIGISASRLQGMDPGRVLAPMLGDASPAVRAAAIRAAGELGRTDLLGSVVDACRAPSPDVAFHGARAACLLGGRSEAFGTLVAIAGRRSTWLEPALALLMLCAGDLDRGNATLRAHQDASAGDPSLARRSIRALGWLGDARAIPGLIHAMSDPVLARVAGESFTLITGADLAALDLEGTAPEDDADGDDGIEVDREEGLPWPEVARVHAWWEQHGRGRFVGGPCFMGSSPTMTHCMDVLRSGCQRQRAVAALRATLLMPGTPLFRIDAPAARQQHALSADKGVDVSVPAER